MHQPTAASLRPVPTRRFPAVLALALLAGCGGPPPPPPTVVNVTLRAAPDVNPTTAGAGAPVALRVYQLASPAGFEGAEFFALLERDSATLKDDLVKRDEVLLAPGATRVLNLTPEPRVRAIGFFAGLRDFQSSAWRLVWAVPPNKTSDIAVIAGRTGLAIAP